MIWVIRIFEKAYTLGVGISFFILDFDQIIVVKVSGNIIQIYSCALVFFAFGSFSLGSIILVRL